MIADADVTDSSCPFVYFQFSLVNWSWVPVQVTPVTTVLVPLYVVLLLLRKLFATHPHVAMAYEFVSLAATVGWFHSLDSFAGAFNCISLPELIQTCGYYPHCTDILSEAYMADEFPPHRFMLDWVLTKYPPVLPPPFMCV